MPKTLAVDWGRVRLGLAVSDELGLTAQGLASLARVSESRDIDAIGAYVEKLGIETIVVGLPRNLDGSLGPSALAVQTFAQALRDRLGLSVQLWDERLTTTAAERTLINAGMRRRARRDVVDQVAAAMILQTYLDRQRVTGERREI